MGRCVTACMCTGGGDGGEVCGGGGGGGGVALGVRGEGRGLRTCL